MNRRYLRLQMALLALAAIPEVERRTAEWRVRDGTPTPGETKRRLALAHMLAAWPESTRCIPGLNLTMISERQVRQQAERALDEAWGVVGETVNALARG